LYCIKSREGSFYFKIPSRKKHRKSSNFKIYFKIKSETSLLFNAKKIKGALAFFINQKKLLKKNIQEKKKMNLTELKNEQKKLATILKKMGDLDTHGVPGALNMKLDVLQIIRKMELSFDTEIESAMFHTGRL
jgi:hypothetical protein